MCFLPNGNVVVTHINDYGNNISILDANRKVLKSFGPLGQGEEDGKFGNTRQISSDKESNIYVVDERLQRIQKFDKDGNFLLKFSVSGTNPLDHPWGVCYLNDQIFVSNSTGKSMNVYSKSGSYIKSINVGAPSFSIKTDGKSLFIGSVGYVIKTDVNGEVIEKIGEGELKSLVPGVALASNGDLLITDTYGDKVFVFKKL
jgi:DNA-binding beta-propeller fold protein YncE